jgi:hypothetical protein
MDEDEKAILDAVAEGSLDWQVVEIAEEKLVRYDLRAPSWRSIMPDRTSQLETNVPVPTASAANGTGVTSAETFSGVQTVTVTFVNTAITMLDEAGVVAYAGLKILDLPEGSILFLGAVADLDLTKSSAGINDDWDGDFGLGTVTATNDATLATTEQDFIPTTATPQATAGATTANGQSTATESGVIFDGTTTPVDVFLNFLVDDADHDVTATACNLIVNGTVKFTYVNLGDY